VKNNTLVNSKSEFAELKHVRVSMMGDTFGKKISSAVVSLSGEGVVSPRESDDK
jgi:hypothetical protein